LLPSPFVATVDLGTLCVWQSLAIGLLFWLSTNNSVRYSVILYRASSLVSCLFDFILSVRLSQFCGIILDKFTRIKSEIGYSKGKTTKGDADVVLCRVVNVTCVLIPLLSNRLQIRKKTQFRTEQLIHKPVKRCRSLFFYNNHLPRMCLLFWSVSSGQPVLRISACSGF
jgi:hypothetical protein